MLETITMIYFGVLSVEDIKTKQIRKWLVIIGAMMIPFSLMKSSNLQLIYQGIGGLIGLVFIGINRLSKGAIGLADAIMITYLGIIYGVYRCLLILCASFFICCIFCMIGAAFHRLKRKQRVPFLPFLFLGNLFCILVKF